MQQLHEKLKNRSVGDPANWPGLPLIFGYIVQPHARPVIAGCNGMTRGFSIARSL